MCTSGNFSRCCLADLITDIDTPSISHCLSGALLWFAIQGILWNAFNTLIIFNYYRFRGSAKKKVKHHEPQLSINHWRLMWESQHSWHWCFSLCRLGRGNHAMCNRARWYPCFQKCTFNTHRASHECHREILFKLFLHIILVSLYQVNFLEPLS